MFYMGSQIGNWSRWLTDIFGVDEDEADSENAVDDDERISNDTSSKCFHLLNALSDLMMLPKDLLLSQTVRKEVRASKAFFYLGYANTICLWHFSFLIWSQGMSYIWCSSY